MEVFKKYYLELVHVLPMDDPTFTEQLYSQNTLSSSTKSQLDSKHTKAEKATYFLDNAIKPALLIKDDTSFQVLLASMENYGVLFIENLANRI